MHFPTSQIALEYISFSPPIKPHTNVLTYIQYGLTIPLSPRLTIYTFQIAIHRLAQPYYEVSYCVV